MAQRDRKARSKFHAEGDGIVMEFGSKNEKGEFVAASQRHFALSKLPGVTGDRLAELVKEAPLLVKLAQHGLKQKVSDSFANPDSDPATSAADVYETLVGGEWGTRGEGGAKTPAIYIQALARIHGVSVEEALKRYEAKSEAAQKDLRNHAKTRAMVETIKEEKAKERKRALSKAAKDADEMDFGEVEEEEAEAGDGEEGKEAEKTGAQA